MKRRMTVFAALLLALALLLPPTVSADTYAYGYGETPLGSSSENKVHNIELAASILNGWVVSEGETFSFNQVVGPRTAEMGYLVAENGRSARVRGGGVAQVATTLYLAVRQIGAVTIDEKHTYGKKFSDGYVSDPNDAVLTDYKAGTDFRFTNWGDALEILIWDDGVSLCCSVGPLYDYEGGEDAASLIGYAATYVGGHDARRSNIELAADALSGAVIPAGGVFSFNGIVGPRSKEAGYQSAVNGRGVRVTGGGVAQVASTVYLAVKGLPGITILEKRTYGDSFNQSYVDDPADAIVTDYGAGTDFSFRNDGGAELFFSAYVDETGWLCCEVWEGGLYWTE